MTKPLVSTKDLVKYFKTPAGNLHAVDHISLDIYEGKTLGVVGESGCGKSTLGRVILRLLEATNGEVLYNGENILKYDHHQLKEQRKKMQIIFQDPYSSLNPRMTVMQLIAEPLLAFKAVKGRNAINRRVLEIMDIVGLAQRFINTYPHELDGGRRQRIGVARALALEPKFIVCDEPVSALDVSIQAQILNLLMDLQDQMGITYMFITHDLSVVKHISHEIAVLYLGQCVERASSEELFKNPMHPYTKALLKAIPVPALSSKGKPFEIIKGEITSPINPKPGCRFAPRCPNVTDKCTGQNLSLKEVSANHFVSCVLYE